MNPPHFGSHSNWFDFFYVIYLSNRFPNKLLSQLYLNAMIKGGLEKDLISTIGTIVRVFLLTCMLGPLENDENQSLS